jgi:hypothetical protein
MEEDERSNSEEEEITVVRTRAGRKVRIPRNRHKYMTPAARHQVAEAADRLPRNLMDEDVQYASVFSGTTKRFNNTMPLITPGLILKVAEGSGCMMLMHSLKNHGESVLCVNGSFDPERPVAGLRLAASWQAVGTP